MKQQKSMAARLFYLFICCVNCKHFPRADNVLLPRKYIYAYISVFRTQMRCILILIAIDVQCTRTGNNRTQQYAIILCAIKTNWKMWNRYVYRIVVLRWSQVGNKWWAWMRVRNTGRTHCNVHMSNGNVGSWTTCYYFVTLYTCKKSNWWLEWYMFTILMRAHI